MHYAVTTKSQLYANIRLKIIGVIMIGGLLLVAAGILIALFPPLLSIIVAIILILMGSMVVAIAYHNRKLRKHYENPVVELFFRL